MTTEPRAYAAQFLWRDGAFVMDPQHPEQRLQLRVAEGVSVIELIDWRRPRLPDWVIKPHDVAARLPDQPVVRFRYYRWDAELHAPLFQEE